MRKKRAQLAGRFLYAAFSLYFAAIRSDCSAYRHRNGKRRITAQIACSGDKIRGKASVKSKSRKRTALQGEKSVKQRKKRLKALKEKIEAAALRKSREERMPMRFFR